MRQFFKNTPPLFIILDLDDTLFETEKAMTAWINEHRDPTFVWKNRLNRKDPVEGPLLMDCLAAGEFMKHAQFCPGFEKIEGFMDEMTRLYSFVRFAFATHRGYHLMAKAFTVEQFRRLGFSMEGVFLDPEIHPCKKTWLDANLGEQYVLYDDNPHWKGGTTENVDNIFLMDKLWNQHEIGYPRIFNYEDLTSSIENRIMHHLTA